MKNFFISIAYIWIFTYTMSIQASKEIALSFDSNDFGIEYHKTNEGFISVKGADFYYDEDGNLPCIPYKIMNVAIPSNCQIQDFEFKADYSVLKKDIKLAVNPEIQPTNQVPSLQKYQEAGSGYKAKVYPDKCVQYVSSNLLGYNTILTFKVTPFKYDAVENVLSFAKSITLNIVTKNNDSQQLHLNPFFKPNDVKRIVINPEDVSEVSTYESRTKLMSSTGEKIDYLIVTNSALKPSFVPLQEWKMMKGVRTKILTTEEIASNYEGDSMQLKIKNCLYDYYLHHDLQYVLLGGDDSVVASQGCYVLVNASDNAVYTYNDMPTDLYYACFGGTFDWNLDGDEIWGETTDGVDLTPYISVTRAPVRTTTDASAFVNKTLIYERTPTANGWNNQILMCGTKLWTYFDSGNSDAEEKGDRLFREAFTSWTGSRKCFYDTYTDFPEGASYDLNTSNLQSQITNGYAFIDMITHGNKTIWSMESGANYSTSNAIASVGNHPTIITTMACLSNAFDQTPDPCLSEAFIRNPNNGIVAYLGCSREGWGYKKTSNFGPSLSYEKKFYQNLFSNSTNKSFGKIVAEAKYSMSGLSQFYNANRWVMFGLNPIGDSEMPIYTSTPTNFDNVAISNDANNIIVDAGVPGCNICLMSVNDMGTTYYEVRENVQSSVFNDVNTGVSICITKNNFIPYIATSGVTYLQNETITGEQNITNNTIIMGSHVTTTKESGPVVFENGNTTVSGNVIIMEEGTFLDSNSSITFTNN